MSTSPDNATILFDREEFGVLGNTLNEVLNAFSWDFSHTGWTKDEVRQLHQRIVATYRGNDSGEFTFTLTKRDILFLIEAIGETIQELGRGYSIRMGYTVEEARQLQVNLQSASQLLQQAS